MELDAKRKKIPYPDPLKLKLTDIKNLTLELVKDEEVKSDKKNSSLRPDSKTKDAPVIKKQVAVKPATSDPKKAKQAEPVIAPDASDLIEYAIFHRKQAGALDAVVSESVAKQKKLLVPQPFKLQLPSAKPPAKPTDIISFVKDEEAKEE